jgi:hypothetical protein
MLTKWAICVTNAHFRVLNILILFKNWPKLIDEDFAKPKISLIGFR